MNEPLKTPRHKSIYILPNLFTAAALFAGFYAIIQAINQHFESATVAIFIAMFLDAMDGRVARLTHTQSAFGEQFDSLSDMLSFGVAPALVVYEWALRDLGKFGWLTAFIYCACAALRLARFNANIGIIDKRFFQGLPSPAGAALVAGMIWLATNLGYSGASLGWLPLGMTLFAGISMVTNILFWSFKDVHVNRRVPFIMLIAVVAAFILASAYPPAALFGLFLIYALSGYVIAIGRWIRKARRNRRIETKRPDQN